MSSYEALGSEAIVGGALNLAAGGLTFASTIISGEQNKDLAAANATTQKELADTQLKIAQLNYLGLTKQGEQLSATEEKRQKLIKMLAIGGAGVLGVAAVAGAM